MEFTDRYKALGIPYPDPQTMCEGQCEGTGFVPIYMRAGDHRVGDRLARGEDEADPVYVALWQEAERKNAANDGWHFVKCPDCGGTGKRLSG